VSQQLLIVSIMDVYIKKIFPVKSLLVSRPLVELFSLPYGILLST